MRKWLSAIVVLAAVAAPASGQAAVRPLVRYAAGTASMTEYLGGGEFQNFTMKGAFRLGRNAYRGTVTGYWSFDASTGGNTSAFSGTDGGHAFSATCTAFRVPFSGSIIGEGPPGPAVESMSCQVSIDGSSPAGLRLAFVWLTEKQASCSRCDAFAFKGVFVGF